MPTPAPMKLLVPEGWTPETVVAVAGPVPIGDLLTVRDAAGRDLGMFEVTHLYRYQCDGQPGDAYLVVTSPGTRHVTIVHQRDYRPAVQTEWAAGLAECDTDECPDCGYGLADDLSGRLVRTPRSSSAPCASCVWAHGEPEAVPGHTDVPELTPDELDGLWTLLAAVRLDGELSDYLLRDEIDAIESTVDKIRAWRRTRGFRMEWREDDDPDGTPYTWDPTDVPDADAR